MELDALDAFLDVGSKLSLEDAVQVVVVRQSAVLMELSEQLIELKSGVVEDPLVPVAVGGKTSVLLLEAIDDLLEVPGEGKHVGMFLF
jgi:hypothetical protein